MNGEILKTIGNASKKPGVYIWKDEHSKIIYIGKADNLRNRLRNYLKPQDPKTLRLVEAAHKVETIITPTPQEALILEDALVKQNQPRYNVMLRDDKRYPYLRITNEKYPRIELVRRVEADGSRYFGPYTDQGAVRKITRLVGELFGICKCAKDHKQMKRPCLNHSLGICAAPYTITGEKEYAKLVSQACDFLAGKHVELAKQLGKQIRERSRELDYEKAIKLRDKLRAVAAISEKHDLASSKLKDMDVLGYAYTQPNANITQMKVRDHCVVALLHHGLRGEYANDPAKSIKAFIEQHYSTPDITPSEIVTSANPEDKELLEKVLAKKLGKKISINAGVRGQKRRLCDMASKNSIHHLTHEQLQKKNPDPLTILMDVFRLPRLPKRIEGYDISNLGEKETVGGMVVFTDGKPDKNQYRRFKIRNQSQNDPANMAEMIQRRLKHNEWQTPDLILLDGGKTQLNACRPHIPEHINVIALSKADEELHHPRRKHAIKLADDNPALNMLKSVRDEAHRYSKAYHIKRRGKDFI